MLGIVILAAAVAAVVAVFLGTSWWMALAIYAFGGAVLTVAFAWIAAKRSGASLPTTDSPSRRPPAEPGRDAGVKQASVPDAQAPVVPPTEGDRED